MKKILKNKLLRFFKYVYLKIFRINDSAQKIALGFGIGVMLGILPATGPLASLFVSSLCRVNRASAVLGSLLTNTWLSFATFFLALKLGCTFLHIDLQTTQKDITALLKHFRFADLLRISFVKNLLPIIIGYIIISAALGILAYLAALIMLKIFKKNEKKPVR